MGMQLSLVALLAAGCAAYTPVVWRVSTTQRLPITPTVAEWFAASDEALPCVVEASESILSVEKLSDELYRGVVAQSNFPFVKIEPSMTFRVARELDGHVSTTLVEQDMKVSGPSLLRKIVLAASSGMATQSSTLVRCLEVEAGGWELEAESTTEIELRLPSWVPIAADKVQQGGQAAIAQQIEGDIAVMLGNLAMKAPAASAPEEVEALTRVLQTLDEAPGGGE